MRDLVDTMKTGLDDDEPQVIEEQEGLSDLDYWQLREEWERVGREVQDDQAFARQHGYQRDGALFRENKLFALGNRMDNHAR